MGEPRRDSSTSGDVEHPLPEQARIGLLNYITAHSLDEDYAHLSERRARIAGDAEQRRTARRSHLPTLLALAVFGLLLATAAVQAARTEPVRRSSHESLAAQAQDRRSELVATRAQVLELRTAVEAAQQDALEASRAGRALRAQLARLGVLTGAEPAAGPGVRVVVDDSPAATEDGQVVLDTDLQILINGLWVSGAEAVAINDQRLTALSAIRVAGEAVTVNLRSLSRPYVVTAIGDPQQLSARLLDSAAGTWWLNLSAVYDLRFDMTTEESLTVPAAPTLDLRHARRMENAP